MKQLWQSFVCALFGHRWLFVVKPATEPEPPMREWTPHLESGNRCYRCGVSLFHLVERGRAPETNEDDNTRVYVADGLEGVVRMLRREAAN